MQAIATSAVVLEPLVAGHADVMFELLNDAELHRYLDFGPPASVEHLRRVYAQLEGRRSPDGRETWLNWVVRPREGSIVGVVQATVGSNASAYVAYMLGRKHWGHGYALEAMHTMLDHLSDAYGVERCLATVEAQNQRSIRLLQRLGFHMAHGPELDGHGLSGSERLFVRQLP